MNFCSNCGDKITTEGTIFCPKCGNQVNLDSGVLNPSKENKGKPFKSWREYIELQYEKISFKKSKLKVIKIFVQENLVLIFGLNFIAYLLLTITPAAVGWIYIVCVMLWGYLYPLLTESNQIKFNQKMEYNLVNSDVIIKKHFKEQKRAKIEREKELEKDRQLEEDLRVEKELQVAIELRLNNEFELQAEKDNKQKEQLPIKSTEVDTFNRANTSANISNDSDSTPKKKSRINTIILFFGMIPIFIVVSIILNSDYLVIEATGALLLPTLIISFLSSMIYYIPTFISRGTEKTTIFIINLLFGWSIIGWIICLVWAMNDNSKWDIMQVMEQNSKMNAQINTKSVE